MSLLTRITQIAAKVGTEGSYSDTVEDADYAGTLLFEPSFKWADTEMHERNPVRATLGALPRIPGAQLSRLNFKTELKGSGTAGTPPAFAAFLKACGFSETINSGSASNTAPVAFPKNQSSAAIAPAISGTFSGTKNGRFVLTLESLVTDTSATFRWQFFPDDGTAFSTGTVTITDTNPTSMTLGLSLATGADPNSTTTGWRIGDRWTFTATSSSSVSVTYRTISSSIPCLDLAVYQDGRRFGVHSARGNMKLVARVGQPVMLEFDLQGVPNDKEDTAVLSGIGYDPTSPAPFIGVTATLDGEEPACYTAFDLDLGNTLAARQCAGEAAGYIGVRITDRQATGALDTEADLLANADPFENLITGAQLALAMSFGSDAGNIVTISCPQAQVLDVEDGDRDGNRIDALSLGFNEPEFSETNEYSEIVITFT